MEERGRKIGNPLFPNPLSYSFATFSGSHVRILLRIERPHFTISSAETCFSSNTHTNSKLHHRQEGDAGSPKSKIARGTFATRSDLGTQGFLSFTFPSLYTSSILAGALNTRSSRASASFCFIYCPSHHSPRDRRYPVGC